MSCGRRQDRVVLLRKAMTLYERAATLDPGFVEAWAQLSRAACSMASTTLHPDDRTRCKDGAARALALAQLNHRDKERGSQSVNGLGHAVRGTRRRLHPPVQVVCVRAGEVNPPDWFDENRPELCEVSGSI